MDFKGHFAIDAGRCHPLTLLDDHSRYAVCLSACARETTQTVQNRLVATFRLYGLSNRMNVGNGSLWGERAQAHTPLSVWLLRVGVRLSHSRAYHPQTNGKDERFHRTLKRAVPHARRFADMVACQQAFDGFREIYNVERPHEALQLAVPASRYRSSPRDYPKVLVPVEYDATDKVRRVQQFGWISFKGHLLRLPKAFAGESVAVQPTQADEVWDIASIRHRIAQVELRKAVATLKSVTHAPEHWSPMSPICTGRPEGGGRSNHKKHSCLGPP